MYQVRFAGHCGMSYDVDDPTEDLKEVRQTMAGYIRRKRAQGHHVTRVRTKRDGKTPREALTFEVETESNRSGVFVTDDDGLLFYRHDQFECRECGCLHETKDAQAYCCSEQERLDMEDEDLSEEE